jgi:L-asparaginase/Glu-tRNA(Gln) amidotransferase subunit D
MGELRFLARLFITNIAIPVLVTGAQCSGVNPKVNGPQ